MNVGGKNISQRRFEKSLSDANSKDCEFSMEISFRDLQSLGVIKTKLSELTATQHIRASLIAPVIASILGRTDLDAVAEQFSNDMDAEKSLLFWERFVCAAAVCFKRRPTWVHDDRDDKIVCTLVFSSIVVEHPAIVIIPDATVGVDPYTVTKCLTLSTEELTDFWCTVSTVKTGRPPKTEQECLFYEAWRALSDHMKNRISAAEDSFRVACRLAKTCKRCGVPSMITKSCGRCGGVRYCSKQCQTDDWKAGHKNACGK